MKFYSLLLSLICIFFFMLQNLIPNFTGSLLLNQQAILQVYRFITAIFLHGSLQHLIFNLFALVMFGLILEKFIGSNKFLIIFFSSGILANLISFNFYESSLGASGAIFGIMGALTLLKPLMTVWAFNLPMPLFLASSLWAIADILGIFYPTGTGNIAHLSGLFLGLIFGLFLRIKHEKKQVLEYSRASIPESYIQVWEDDYVKNHGSKTHGMFMPFC